MEVLMESYGFDNTDTIKKASFFRIFSTLLLFDADASVLSQKYLIPHFYFSLTFNPFLTA